MSSVHLYQAEQKDFDKIFEMLMEFKEGELFDKKLPEVDKPIVKPVAPLNASIWRMKIESKSISLDQAVIIDVSVVKAIAL